MNSRLGGVPPRSPPARTRRRVRLGHMHEQGGTVGDTLFHRLSTTHLFQSHLVQGIRAWLVEHAPPLDVVEPLFNLVREALLVLGR